MSHDVFISCSSKDKAIANATCAALEAQKIRCWIAPRDVMPGTDYTESILGAIESCRVMVLVFSDYANKSPHIRREVERAVSKVKVIVPFRIENVLPSGGLEYCLSTTHWLDALTPPIEAHIKELVSAVQRLLDEKKGPPPIAVSDEENPGKPMAVEANTLAPKGRQALFIASLALFVILLCVAGIYFWPVKKPETPCARTARAAAMLKEELVRPGFTAETLRKLEQDLAGIKESAGECPEVEAAEGLFRTRSWQCVSNEWNTARRIISGWEEASEFNEWSEKLALTNVMGQSDWSAGWQICHSVATNAVAIIANLVSQEQAEQAEVYSSAKASEAENWNPGSWSRTREYFIAGARAQREGRWREAWSSFHAFRTNAEAALEASSQKRNQYEALKTEYERIAYYASDQVVQRILAEYAGEGLHDMQTLAQQAAQQANPKGTTNYADAIAAWPDVVGDAVTNLLTSGAASLADTNWDAGLKAVTNIQLLSDRARLTNRARWVTAANNLRNQIASAIAALKAGTNRIVADPAPKPPIIPPPAVPPPPRFKLVDRNIIVDQKTQLTWIVPDLSQPVSLAESRDREHIEEEKNKYHASLPTLDQVALLATEAKVLWPDGDWMHLDAAFATTLPHCGPWQLSKKCCAVRAGILGITRSVLYDFEANKPLETAVSEKGVLLLVR